MSIPNQAMANALAGEKDFSTIAFPLTGEAELDAMSGILAVLKGVGLENHGAVYERIGLWLSHKGRTLLQYQIQYQQMARQRAAVNPIPACPLPYEMTSVAVGGAGVSSGISAGMAQRPDWMT